MHPIRKFVESLDYGRVSNRVGYAADPTALPKPMSGAEWREDTSFREAEAASNDTTFARVIEHARKHGYATVSR